VKDSVLESSDDCDTPSKVLRLARIEEKQRVSAWAQSLLLGMATHVLSTRMARVKQADDAEKWVAGADLDLRSETKTAVSRTARIAPITSSRKSTPNRVKPTSLSFLQGKVDDCEWFPMEIRRWNPTTHRFHIQCAGQASGNK
jgi:hypothetical protein